MRRAEAAAALALLILLAVGAWIEVYRFKDCRKVGHTRLYCWLSVAR